MFEQSKSKLAQLYSNFKSWKSNQKIIVFESDDWGSIRIPNHKPSQSPTFQGIIDSNNAYNQFDCLESADDVSALLEMLSSKKNDRGQLPKFTLNSVVANPDFDKIKAGKFNTYFWQSIRDTYEEYYPSQKVLEVHLQGIKENLIVHQFHGREHLNVPLWMSCLNDNNTIIRQGFEEKLWSIARSKSGIKGELQASFGAYSTVNHMFYEEMLESGLAHFEALFGYRSKTFIATNYIWPNKLNSTLARYGIEGLQGAFYQQEYADGNFQKKVHFTGEMNSIGQYHLVRNCVFEPTLQPKLDSVRTCLRQIQNAFFWNAPAIVVTHRLNYIGELNQANRRDNLNSLKELLSAINKKWPDVQFMTSDELILKIQAETTNSLDS